jgi:hypothetical protein
MQKERKYFRREGVVIKYTGLTMPIELQRLPLPALAAMPAVPGGFEPFRRIINLKIVDLNHPKNKLNKFKPALVVRIRFTDADLAQAAAKGKPLSLGFWDGTKWVRLEPPTYPFHLVHKPTKKFAGWGVLILDRWGDPPKAWGT